MPRREHAMLNFDKAKLYGAIKRRGYTAAEVSREAGFSDSYLAGACAKGCMVSETFARYIEKVLNIPRSEYEVVQENQTNHEIGGAEPTAISEHAVYRATYTAIMNTWSFIREDLKAIVKEALNE